MQNRARLLIGLAILAWLPLVAETAPFAYIANYGSNTVSVIDTATYAIVTTVPVGNGPYGVAVSRMGERIYVTNRTSNDVTVIDGTANVPVATISVGVSPVGIAVTSDGRRAYVANSGSNSVSVIDTSTNAVTATVSVGDFPFGVAVNPAGTRTYVTNRTSGLISVIDIATNTIVPTVGLPCYDGTSIRLNVAGTKIYCGSGSISRISVFDASMNTPIEAIPLIVPWAIALNKSETRIYARTRSSGVWWVEPNEGFYLQGSIAAGVGPGGISKNPEGSKFFAVNSGSDTVSVIDAQTDKVIQTVAVGSTPVSFGQFIAPEATTTTPVIEYYNKALDHYFITWVPLEIAILDAGTQIKGWNRTGYSSNTHASPQAGSSPVCRYYIPPELGDSHFFGRGTLECDATGQRNPSFILEDPAFMHVFLPAKGVCPANTTQVNRVFSNRPDANHRYMTDRTVRDQMVAKGWLAEGDGPDLVVMCAPQ